MAEQNILNLPPFGNNASFPASPDAGRWGHADGSLRSLARSLRLPKVPFADADEPVRAIPDPWAQARSFGEALLDPPSGGNAKTGSQTGHSMHVRALAQWRGLLALFALREMRSGDYSLSPRPVSLDGDELFERVLSHLPPMGAMGDQAGLWLTPSLIMIAAAGQPARALAMTNPICLVSPGRMSLAVPIPGIAWAQSGMVDPLTLVGASALPVTELAVLETWLLALQTRIAPVGGEICGKICQLLKDYADDCREQIGRVTIEIAVENSSELLPAPLFRELWIGAVPTAITDPASQSQTRLALRADLGLGDIKGIILVDESLTSLPGFVRGTCFVWGMRTLGELLDSPAAFEAAKRDAASHGCWLITADDLFTERAVRLANEPVIAGHPVGLQDMILPLRPLTMMIEGGHRKVSGKVSGTRATVSIEVKLQSQSGALISHKLTRSYANQPAAGEKLLVSAAIWQIYNATLWPDFKSKAWNSYTARFYYPEGGIGKSLRPLTAISGAVVAEEISGISGADVALQRLSDLNWNTNPAPQTGRFLKSVFTAQSRYDEMQYSTRAFDAICYVEGQADRAEVSVGMVMLELQEFEVSSTPTIAAVDFGTTNTVACLGSPEPILFKPRLVFPIVPNRPDLMAATLLDSRLALGKFWPVDSCQTPTPTVADSRLPYPSDVLFFAFRNMIYFHRGDSFEKLGWASEQSALLSLEEDGKFNLKWNEDSAHSEAASDYLEQFMIMIAAEATAQRRDPQQIRWRFSIPDSLVGKKRTKFQDHLLDISERISTNVPDNSELPVLAPLYSEGLAAASYMLLEAGNNAADLNMVLDIGGGTTDVTIWVGEVLKWKGSFRLAGLDFFTAIFAKNPEIFREIGLKGWIEILKPGNNKMAHDVTDQTDGHSGRRIAEILFSGTRLSRAIDDHWNSRLNKNTGLALRITSLTFLGGIAWYMGLIARKLAKDGVIDSSKLNSLAFALCGRGAGMFTKIHGRNDAEAETEVTQVLRLFSVAAEIQMPPYPQFFPTKQAKMEVVRGMIGDSKLIDASAKSGLGQALDVIVAGLGISFGTAKPVAADGDFGENALPERVEHLDMAGFDAFIAALEKHGGIRLDLRRDSNQLAYATIRTEARKRLEKARNDPDIRLAIEPPFISALRALIDELAAPTEERNKRLKMEFCG